MQISKKKGIRVGKEDNNAGLSTEHLHIQCLPMVLLGHCILISSLLIKEAVKVTLTRLFSNNSKMKVMALLLMPMNRLAQDKAT